MGLWCMLSTHLSLGADMTDDKKIDLGNLTLQMARTWVGQDFVVPDATGHRLTLRLMEAEPAQNDLANTSSESGRPFSLVFLGPTEPMITQGMHDLEHADHPLLGIFLVPMGQGVKGCSYEAIFS